MLMKRFTGDPQVIQCLHSLTHDEMVIVWYKTAKERRQRFFYKCDALAEKVTKLGLQITEI
jgi:hypothetical protein